MTDGGRGLLFLREYIVALTSHHITSHHLGRFLSATYICMRFFRSFVRGFSKGEKDAEEEVGWISIYIYIPADQINEHNVTVGCYYKYEVVGCGRW